MAFHLTISCRQCNQLENTLQKSAYTLRLLKRKRMKRIIAQRTKIKPAKMLRSSWFFKLKLPTIPLSINLCLSRDTPSRIGLIEFCHLCELSLSSVLSHLCELSLSSVSNGGLSQLRRYEEIRSHILEQPFVCEAACEWRPEISCDDQPDIMQDGSRLWAIDKPNIAHSSGSSHCVALLMLLIWLRILLQQLQLQGESVLDQVRCFHLFRGSQLRAAPSVMMLKRREDGKTEANFNPFPYL